MKHTDLENRRATRIVCHRRKAANSGSKRVEVMVPSRDVMLIKAIAAALRLDGEEARHVRQSLQSMLSHPIATSGSELVAFLRASPLTDTELSIERDKSVGRSARFD